MPTNAEVVAVGSILSNEALPLKQRYRALFTLKNIGTDVAVQCIAENFTDPSELLKHELAYCLGQMQSATAVDTLKSVLQDTEQQPIVRHEAAEALGAIGKLELLPLLESYAKDPVPEVAETCEIAVDRIRWLSSCPHAYDAVANPFASVDPAPPFTPEEQGYNLERLESILLNESLPIFQRYRAMFTLRNIGNSGAVTALARGLDCPRSTLFRHEVAFVMGQMAPVEAVPYLQRRLEDLGESAIVRHECAEALGSIATDECVRILRCYASDEARMVRESVEVALDMSDYENSDQFQYADGLLAVAALGRATATGCC